MQALEKGQSSQYFESYRSLWCCLNYLKIQLLVKMISWLNPECFGDFGWKVILSLFFFGGGRLYRWKVVTRPKFKFYLVRTCWFQGSRIISAASNLVFWTFFRAKTCCVVCHSYSFCYRAKIWREKMSKKPCSIRLLRWFDFSQSVNRRNNRRTFEGASVEPTIPRFVEYEITKLRKKKISLCYIATN